MQVKRNTALPPESLVNRAHEGAEGNAASPPKVTPSREPAVRQTPERDAQADAGGASNQPRRKVLNAWDVWRVAPHGTWREQQPRPAVSFPDSSADKRSPHQEQQAWQRERQRLEAHFYNQPGMQELAGEVARLQQPLSTAMRAVAALDASCDKGKAAQEAAHKAWEQAQADLRRETGLSYEECLARKQELDSKRAEYFKPMLADLRKELQVHTVALQHVRHGLELCLDRVYEDKAELNEIDRKLVRLRRNLNSSERALEQPSMSRFFDFYSAQKDSQNQRLFHLLKEKKGERAAQRLAASEFEYRRESLVAGTLLDKEQQLVTKQRVLKQLIGGFATQQQMEQAGQLDARQQVLGSLVASLKETREVLARHQRTIESDWSFDKVLKICPSVIGACVQYIRKRALKARIAHEVDAVRHLSRQLDVDPASLWVRIAKDGAVSLSDRTLARTMQGQLLNPRASLFNDSPEPVTPGQANASFEQQRVAVETLVEDLRRTAGQNLEHDSPPEAPPCGDEIDVGYIKLQAGSDQRYQEQLQQAVLEKYCYSQPGVRAFSEGIDLLVKKGLQLALACRAKKQEQVVALADEMTNSLPRLRDAIADLEVADFGIKELDDRVKDLEERLCDVRKGSTDPEALQRKIAGLGDAMDVLKGRLLEPRRQEVWRRQENMSDRWGPRWQGRTREERLLNTPRSLLLDEHRVLTRLISGFQTCTETVRAKLVSDNQCDLGNELRKNPGSNGKLEEIRSKFDSGYSHRRALGIGQNLMIVHEDKDGKPVLSEFALAMYRAGVLELRPVYRRRHDATVSMHYEARVEKNGTWIDQKPLKEWLQKRAVGQGREAQAARDALAALAAQKKAIACS
ncbi:MAG: hypothetical protein OXC07_03540 [Kistimonas sp.]|nr:hypothetical protein [Kistimonas sp.]